jgi:hypothetical protein
MKQADRIVGRVVGPERVGTHQLGTVGGLVYFGAPDRPHFVQDRGDSGGSELPGGLAAGKTGTDDMDGRSHSPYLMPAALPLQCKIGDRSLETISADFSRLPSA